MKVLFRSYMTKDVDLYCELTISTRRFVDPRLYLRGYAYNKIYHGYNENRIVENVSIDEQQLQRRKDVQTQTLCRVRNGPRLYPFEEGDTFAGHAMSAPHLQ